MSFGKAKRFEKENVCGPPPTAYAPKLLDSGGGVAIFSKGERFKENTNMDAPLTRSQSQSSVGSTGSSISKNGKKPDHSKCNKQIDDLENQLRLITLERNQLFALHRKSKSKTTNVAGSSKDENKENEPIVIDSAIEIALLNQTIADLKAKIEEAKDLEEEKQQIENERDDAITDLELKSIEITQLHERIESLKANFKQEEDSLRSEMQRSLQQATEEKESVEAHISELGLKIENLENIRVELTKEIESTKEIHSKELSDVKATHVSELEDIQATHALKVQQLENNLQQLAAEHDAESEQMKFEFSRQIEELLVKHAATIEELNGQHAAQVEQIRSDHQEQIHRLETAKDELDSEKSRLSQEVEKVTLTLETKLDEVATLSTQLEVAKEKIETGRLQANEKYEAMKNSLQLDIAECQSRAEEERRNLEEALRSHFEAELDVLRERSANLEGELNQRQVQLQELEKAHVQSNIQHEEQLQRLNENNHTEKEILMWQMNQQKENVEQELKGDFERQISEKDAEIQNQATEWQAKLNQAREEFDIQISTIKSNHTAQLANNSELHEAALSNLEREKNDILAERASIEKKLLEKEAELEKVTGEMKTITEDLKIQLDMLRESNNELVADLLRVEREKQISENRLESELIEMRAQAEQEKASTLQSHQEHIGSMQSEFALKEERITELTEALSAAEQVSRKELEEKTQLLEQLKIEKETEISQLVAAHKAEINQLHKNYERVFGDKDDKFAADVEQLTNAHRQMMEELKQSSQAESQQLQADFQTSFANLERKLQAEKQQQIEEHSQKLSEAETTYQNKLALVQQQHDVVVKEITNKCEEALNNTKILEECLNGIRNDYHNALAAANQVEVQHGARVEELENSIQQKTEELEKMRESVRRRDKQTADEWIQRETALMTQFSSQNQETTSNYETKLAALAQELETTRVTAQSMKKERDEARDDIAVFQIQTEAQLSALNEQYDQERSMLLGKMAESHALQMNELHTKVAESQAALEQVRRDQSIQLKQLEQEHRDAILMAVQDAMEPLDDELNELRKERQAYLLLQKEYEELKDRIEPFREQLEMYEAEKNALLKQTHMAESTMASLATKYTQLLGHQNSRQKIHHLEKLKQDIFNLRKELADKNLALEKEKKTRQKVEARLKEFTGSKKYDPSEAFKVPDNPAVTTSSAPSSAGKARMNLSTKPLETVREVTTARRSLRPVASASSGTGFFLAMDEVDKTAVQMEQEKQKRLEQRRQASKNFEVFSVDFGETNMRRETFDVPTKLNQTQLVNGNQLQVENKENSRGFPSDISGISPTEEQIPIQKSMLSMVKATHNDVFTSTPLQRQNSEQ